MTARLTSTSPEVVQSGLEFMKRGYSAWLGALAVDGKQRYLRACLQRSVFENRLTRNICRLARDGDWSNTPDVHNTAVASWRGFGQSKIVDDANHFVRSGEERDAAHENACATGIWHKLYEKKIISEACSEL